MDDGIRLPGTRVRIGLDPILGLVPGLGDAIGAILASAILVEGVRRRLPPAVLLRVAVNIVLDALLGSVPVAGDVFDALWRANLRNLALVEGHRGGPQRAPGAEGWVGILLAGLLVTACLGLLLGAVIVGAVALGRWLTASF